MPTPDIELGVSDFVALINQSLEYAYNGVVITGELANLRVSKGKWLYFDLKDEGATVKFFGTVYQLPGPLEDGMILKVRGLPRLHNLYGFSVNVQSIQTAGEGSIKRAAELLQAKLAKEGLFDAERKRILPYPPERIGLIASKQSAAYADFIKILNARWGGLQIEHIDVQVQGDVAPNQIIAAIKQFNAQSQPPEVLILVRGGGSAEDLAAFSTEQVTRAVAASRVPTLVAIGHEVDVSLAELAADQRGSTPSNAAELLTPDRRHAAEALKDRTQQLAQLSTRVIAVASDRIVQRTAELQAGIDAKIVLHAERTNQRKQLLEALSPEAVLRRGFAIARNGGAALRSNKSVKPGAIVEIRLADGSFSAQVKES